MTLHVVFTPEGIPGWIGPAPRDGSEPVEGLDLPFLAAHRRTAEGEWVPRDPVRVSEPTPEEVDARRRVAHEAAVRARADAVRQALAEEADPLFFKWQRDECDREEWLARVAEVKARFPKLAEVNA